MIEWLKERIRQWRCDHAWKWRCNYHGRLIVMHDGKRSGWECTKCGKWEDRSITYEPDDE